MGLYDLKEFLTFEDVADYLRDKGIYDVDLSFESDYIKLKDLIKELYSRKQITPVFHFWGAVMEQTHKNGVMIGKEILTRTNGYLMIDDDIFTLLISIGQERAPLDYFYELYDNKKIQEYAYFYKPVNDRFIRFMDLLYPRIDFDTLIDRQLSNEPLQAENDRLKAEIEQLQNQSKGAGVADLTTYQTPLMAIMNEVINEFWLNYTDDKIPPKQITIKHWIKERYPTLSDNEIITIDRIARPPIAKSGKAIKKK